MTRLDHAGVCVADLDAATAFYEQAFGFRVELAFELGIEGIRGVMLALDPGGRLELFERPGSAPNPRPASPVDSLATRGFGHVALSSADIEPVFARALEHGASAKVEPSSSPEPGVRFAFVGDPEGNLVELVERR